MKMWTPEEADPEFELTPMIDVVFLLIAFFMTLISFISSEQIKLTLPEAAEATVPDTPGERQYVSIDSQGNVYFGAENLGSSLASYQSLSDRLREMRQEVPGMRVFLRADSDTAHRYVNRVMAAAAQAGIFDVIFASEQIN
ncbi:MAG: ExbD/TolR family protein [Opitutales bacterium]